MNKQFTLTFTEAEVKTLIKGLGYGECWMLNLGMIGVIEESVASNEAEDMVQLEIALRNIIDLFPR